MARPNETDRLDSWKAIAAYLKRDERTVRRWERELGLPVHRVPGGRGRSVFGFISEIDQWLKTAGPAAATNANLPPATATSVRRWPIAVAGVVSALAAALVIASRVDVSPVRAEVTPSAIIARDARNEVQWRYPFPLDERTILLDHRASPYDSLGGADPGIIAGVSFRYRQSDGTALSGRLFQLTPQGVLLRMFSFDDRLTFSSGSYGPTWAITDFDVHDDGGRRVAVAAHEYTWWPSLVTVLDEAWRRRGTFVNAGWIESVHWLSADRLVALGFSQAFNGGMAAVLDPSDLDGQSPAPAGGPFSCATCGSGRPIRYVVMPRSEVNRVTSSRFNRARLERVGERMFVRTIEVPQGAGDAADALYEFTPSFALVSASFSTRYWEIHRALEQEGKIGHTREDCPDRDGPRDILVWEPGPGWRRVTRPNPM